MREVKYTTRFQRDYKREKSGRHSKKLDALLMEVVSLLAADTPLPGRNSITHFRESGTIAATAI
jgi:mRNA-degrading endonuclease YafQ of YafQ-DinJ toxin-antitoxin module